MPNHITTVLTVSPKVAEAFTRRYTEKEIAAHEEHEQEREKNFAARGLSERYVYEPIDPEERFVDFNLVIPEPEDTFHGGCNGVHPHPKEDGTFYAACWNGWNRDNWGTKWNAYDSEIEYADEEVTIKFDTAWSHPFPVIAALSQQFPDSPIGVTYADEDLGYNIGSYTVLDGEVVKSHMPVEGSPDAVDLAVQIKYGMSYIELLKERGE